MHALAVAGAAERGRCAVSGLEWREPVVLLPNPPRLDGEAMRRALARPRATDAAHDWRRVLASLTSEESEER